MKCLAMLIKKRRDGLNLNQKDLAIKAGTGIKTVQNAEDKDYQVSGLTAKKLAQALYIPDKEMWPLLSDKQKNEWRVMVVNESPITHSEAQRRIMEGVQKMNPKIQKAFADMLDTCLEVQRENKREPET